jgi:hypothetical protein
LLSFGAECFVFQFANQNTKSKIYRTIILPVVLYGCETWSHTLREERRLRVFENGVLRSILGPKRDEVTGEWRRLHNGKLYDLYSLPNIIRVIKSITWKWAWHVASRGERRNAKRVLVGVMKERDHLEDPVVDRKITLQRVFKKSISEGTWTGLIWLRTGTHGGLL